MTDKTYNVSAVFAAACAGLAFFGVTMLSLGPILGRLGDLGINAASISPTLTIGIIIGTLLFGPVVDRFGYKGLIIASSLLALAGVLGLSSFTSGALLQVSICILGIGGGVLNGLTNALVSDIYDDDKRGGRMSLLGAFYCIGALLWTLLNYFMTDYRYPLYIVSAAMVCFIIFFCCIQFPKAKPAENVTFSKTMSLFRYPALLLFGLVLFFQSGLEGSSGDFTVTYLSKQNGIDTGVATLAMTWFTIGMLAGRLVLGSALKAIKDIGTFYVYLGVALVGVAVLFFSKGPVGADIAMTLLGFGVGATFPVVLNHVGGIFRSLSGTAISIAVFIALVGQFALKKLTSVAFNGGNYISLPCILGIAIIAMMCLVPVALKAAKNTNKLS